MRSHHSSQVRLAAALTLTAFLSACATAPHESMREVDPAARARPQARMVAVAAGQFTPEARLEALTGETKGKAAAAGAGAGAAMGATAWLDGLAHSHCSGQMCGGVLILYAATLPVFMGVGAIIGAANDASKAQTAEALSRAELDMQAALAQLKLQEAAQQALAFELARSGFGGVVALGPGEGPAAPGDAPRYSRVAADLVVEVSVLGLEIARERVGSTVLYAPVLRASGRLVRPADGRVEDEVRYEWRGPLAPGPEWTRDQAARFIAALNIGMNQTAEALAYELLLAWYPPRGAAPKARADSLAPPYVLEARQPPFARSFDLRGAYVDRYKGGLGGLVYPYADSVQPLLKWEEFPRGFDGLAAERVTDVVYDLRVFRSVLTGPVFSTGVMVYERSGLRSPEHRVAEDLSPCQRYTWTVRARFRLDGQPRATEWAAAANAWDGVAMEPWEVRRGAPEEFMRRHRMDLRNFYYPFRAPTLGGTQACKG